MPLLNFLMVLLLVLVAGVFGLSFALANSQTVLVHYYGGTQSMPLSLLVLGALVIGLIGGWLAALPTLFKLKIERRY